MKRISSLFHRLDDIAVALQPLFALAIRLYLFRVFFLSGLTKLRSWDSTLYLFSNEYHVPVLPPAVQEGTARLRANVTAAHTIDDIQFALDVFIRAGKFVGVI